MTFEKEFPELAEKKSILELIQKQLTVLNNKQIIPEVIEISTDCLKLIGDEEFLELTGFDEKGEVASIFGITAVISKTLGLGIHNLGEEDLDQESNPNNLLLVMYRNKYIFQKIKFNSPLTYKPKELCEEAVKNHLFSLYKTEYTQANTAPLLLHQKHIQKHCLSKKRVREIIEKRFSRDIAFLTPRVLDFPDTIKNEYMVEVLRNELIHFNKSFCAKLFEELGLEE